MSRLTQKQKEDIHDIIIGKLKLGPSLQIIKGAIDESVRSRMPAIATSDSDKVRECLDFLSNLGAVSVADPLKAFLTRAADTAKEMPEADSLREIAKSLPDPSQIGGDADRSTTSEVDRAREFRMRVLTANNQQLRRLRYEIEKTLLESPKDPDLSELLDKVMVALRSAPQLKPDKPNIQSSPSNTALRVGIAICFGFAIVWAIWLMWPKSELALDVSTLREAGLIENEALLNRSIQLLLNSKSASELDLVLTGSTLPVKSPMQSPAFSVSSSLEGAQLIVDGVLADGDSRSSLTVVPPRLTTLPVVIKVNGKLTKNSRILLVIGVKLSESSPLNQSTPLVRRTEIKKSIHIGNVP